MKMERYYILNKRHIILLIFSIFIFAAMLVLLAISIPAKLSSVTTSAGTKSPIRCTDRSHRVISLTFDASRSDDSINEILRILSKYNIKVTFFVTSEWAERCFDSIGILNKYGHEIMNASNNNSSMTDLFKDKAIKKINSANDIIQSETGVRPILFRPCDGKYDDNLLETVYALDMLPIGWDVDSNDINGLDAKGIVKRVVDETSSGSIIRFNVDGEHTVDALPAIIESFKEKEYTFLPVSSMVYKDDYTINYQGRQISVKKAPR